MFDLLIKNGQAADPATGFFAEADVAVEGGRIALVEPGSTAAAHETISGRRREGTHAVLPHHPPYGSVVGGYLWLH